MKCPVCLSAKNVPYDQDKYRTYYLCEDCELVFVSRDKILPAIDELKRYEAHHNEENDPHYQQYLRQILDSAIPVLGEKAQGLDFGCGKTTVLAQLFETKGIQVDSYDVFFHPYDGIWNRKYDFIILSEVIEHLGSPREVMEKLSDILNQHGKIFIKTKFHPEDPLAFKNWFYKRDLTHVQFFNPKSLGFLSHHLNLTCPIQLNSHDLYLIVKP